MVVDHQREEEYSKVGGVISWQDILEQYVDYVEEKE